MEKKPDDLSGMDAAGAKEYILEYIAALKITEKTLGGLDQELAKWDARIKLAQSRGALDLAGEAEREAEKIKTRQADLNAERAELQVQIESMKRQLPGLAARERSVDPDLLEQELLMAAGRLPGEEYTAERTFKAMEKDLTAEAALEALKTKMRENKPGGSL
jgi:chromosome segregation ATPase